MIHDSDLRRWLVGLAAVVLIVVAFDMLTGCASLSRDEDVPEYDAGLPPDRPPPGDFTDAGVVDYPDAQVPPDAPPPPPTCEPECDCDADCGHGETCRSGKCYDRCQCDADCDHGYDCRWGVCKPNH